MGGVRRNLKVTNFTRYFFLISLLPIFTFQAAVAPMRGFMTSASSTGDSGINTNSNGSQRSSSRGFSSGSRNNFSIGSSSSSSTSSDNDEINPDKNYPEKNYPVKNPDFREVTTTVILERQQHTGCDNEIEKNPGQRCFQEIHKDSSISNQSLQKPNNKPFQVITQFLSFTEKRLIFLFKN